MASQKAIFLKTLNEIYYSHEKTLLALSGGPDSVALFHLLLELKQIKSHFYFEVFHLNHLLRVEADNEAIFVKNLCEKNNIKCYLYEEDIGCLAKKNKISVEEAGRLKRYESMEKLLRTQQLHSISTGHHLNDNIETFLMRLFKGAGLKSLLGMSLREDNRVKPLLGFHKKDIEEFLIKNKYEHCVDQSNLESRFIRNKVRNELIPKIKEIFPAFDHKILQLQDIIKEKELFMGAFLSSWKKIEHQVFSDEWSSIPKPLINEYVLRGLKGLDKNYYLSTKNVKNVVKKLLLFHGKGHLVLYENNQFQIMICYKTLFIINRVFYQLQFSNLILEPGHVINILGEKLENFSDKTIFLNLVENDNVEVLFNHKKKLRSFLSDQKIFYHWRKFVYLLKDGNDYFLGLYIIFGKRIFLNNLGKGLVKKIK